jgi:hypothetical protein
MPILCTYRVSTSILVFSSLLFIFPPIRPHQVMFLLLSNRHCHCMPLPPSGLLPSFALRVTDTSYVGSHFVQFRCSGDVPCSESNCIHSSPPPVAPLLRIKKSCHLQYAHFPNSLDDDMTWSTEILIIFSSTKISKISSQLEISNVYFILFYRLFWTTRFRAEQTNGTESTSTHSATHLPGLSDIVSILFLIAMSVSLTSTNSWPSILFALTEELACCSVILILEAGWLVYSLIPLLAESSQWSSAALVLELCISYESCDMILELAVGYNPNMLVGTLQIGYPHEQALSQDKESDVHSHAATYPAVPDPTSLLRWTLGLSCIQWLQIPPPCVRRALAPPCA